MYAAAIKLYYLWFIFSMYISSPVRPLNQGLDGVGPCSLSFGINGIGKTRLPTSKRALTIQAGYREGEGSASNFLGGFIVGGLIVGTLGYVYAPQISKALAGADKKELMSKLPDFIYNEEKALEKTRKVLSEKIAQLNTAIDDVSSQLRSEDGSNEAVAVAEEELEVAI